MSDVMLTERDEDGAATNPGNAFPAAIAHSPDTPETMSPRAPNEPRLNDASAHFRSSVPRPVDAPSGHQVQPPVLRQGDTLFGQNQKNLQPTLSAMTSNFLPHYPPSYDGNSVSGRSTLDRTMTVRRSSTVVREKFLSFVYFPNYKIFTFLISFLGACKHEERRD